MGDRSKPENACCENCLFAIWKRFGQGNDECLCERENEGKKLSDMCEHWTRDK